MHSGGGSEPRVSWKGGGLPGCPGRTQAPLLPGTGHCLGICSVLVQPVMPWVWELLGGLTWEAWVISSFGSEGRCRGCGSRRLTRGPDFRGGLMLLPWRNVLWSMRPRVQESGSTRGWESQRERPVLLWSPVPGKWDVASGVGWGCPAQGRLWGVAALSSAAAYFSHFPRAESLYLATLPPKAAAPLGRSPSGGHSGLLNCPHDWPQPPAYT